MRGLHPRMTSGHPYGVVLNRHRSSHVISRKPPMSKPRCTCHSRQPPMSFYARPSMSFPRGYVREHGIYRRSVQAANTIKYGLRKHRSQAFARLAIAGMTCFLRPASCSSRVIICMQQPCHSCVGMCGGMEIEDSTESIYGCVIV